MNSKKIDVYIDFDGVMVDTIRVTYKMMEDLGISLEDKNSVFNFYSNLDWDDLLSNIDIINKAFENIELLENSGIFNLNILTTITCLNEMIAKTKFIRSKNDRINILFVPKGFEKSQVVNAKNAVLVDDYGHNIKCWIESEGIGFKFTNDNNSQYNTINSLDELVNERCLSLIKSKMKRCS